MNDVQNWIDRLERHDVFVLLDLRKQKRLMDIVSYVFTPVPC